MKTIQITNQLQNDVLLRIVDGEIKNLVQTMQKCDPSDFMQYQIWCRAQEQAEELREVRKQLQAP
jgi:hypothetical protein